MQNLRFYLNSAFSKKHLVTAFVFQPLTPSHARMGKQLSCDLAKKILQSALNAIGKNIKLYEELIRFAFARIV